MNFLISVFSNLFPFEVMPLNYIKLCMAQISLCILFNIIFVLLFLHLVSDKRRPIINSHKQLILNVEKIKTNSNDTKFNATRKSLICC